MIFAPTDMSPEEAFRSTLHAARTICDRRPLTRRDIKSAMRATHTGRSWAIG